jgi:YVTN family beta-propeller protein
MTPSVVLLSISFLLLQVTILPSTSAYASATTTNNGESKEISEIIVHSTIVLGEEGWENGSPSSIAINEKTNFVYVANRNSDTVVVIDGTTNKVVDSITVGFSPADVAVNPNTNFIYVTKLDVGTVSVIDGSTNRIIKNMEIDDSINFHHAGGIAVNENTNKIYVLTNNYLSIPVHSKM